MVGSYLLLITGVLFLRNTYETKYGENLDIILIKTVVNFLLHAFIYHFGL
jgi:hypothetical protein